MTMFTIKTSKCPVDEPCVLATTFQFTTQPVHRHGRTRSGRGFAKKTLYTEKDVNLKACMKKLDYSFVEYSLFVFGAYDMNKTLEENVEHYALHKALFDLNDCFI